MNFTVSSKMIDDFTSAAEQIGDGVVDAYKASPKEALALLCGLLVGILEDSITAGGGDPARQITINSDGGRSITIHKLGADQDADALDAARYRWLRNRLFGADFDWNGEGASVVLFSWPPDAAIGADLGAAIDAAMARESAAIGGAR